jgi:hypothetical protein
VVAACAARSCSQESLIVPTARQIAAQRKQLRQEAERDRRKKDRASLKQLRAHLRSAKRLAVARRAEVRLLCKRGRVSARERAKVLRAEFRARAAAAIMQEISAARSTCTANQDRAREQNANSIQRAAAALTHEHSHQQHIQRYSKTASLHGRSAPKSRRIEALHESDSEVENNIPHELLPVWRRVKSRIKGTPRRSRTEAFFEWAAEHEPDVQRIIHTQFDADVAELIKHEQELRERVGDASAYRRMSDDELSDVPF